jgi:PAS domain S-box-containing protein
MEKAVLGEEDEAFLAAIVESSEDAVIGKRKKAEAAIRQALEQLREQAALLELAPVLVRDLESRIVLWTRGAEQLYGFSKTEALGRVSHELFQTEFLEGKAHVDEMLRSAGQWEGELVHCTRSGVRLAVTSQQTIYRDTTGNPIRILEVNADITERRQVEQSLRESQAQFAGIIDSAMDAIISVDESQRIVLFNAAAERIFRCEASKALGQPLDRFIPARLRPAHREHVRAFGATGATSRTMGKLKYLTALRADGMEFPIEASISQTEVGGGKLFTAIVRDSTERKAAEDALSRSEERLRGRELWGEALFGAGRKGEADEPNAR